MLNRQFCLQTTALTDSEDKEVEMNLEDYTVKSTHASESLREIAKANVELKKSE